jgi:hypothetical protein
LTLVTIPTNPLALSTLRAALPSTERPLPVRFKTLETGSRYFTSVFLAIHPTPALTALHARIHDVLGLEPKTLHFPHVSLGYVDDSDALLRTAFVERLEQAGRVGGGDGTVRLRFGASEDGGCPWIEGFEGMEIWIVECDGPVEEWKVLEKYTL